MAAERFARLAVPIPLVPFEQLVDYSIPEDLLGQVHPGSLVHLTFGRQKTWGLVFEVTDQPQIDRAKIKPISGLKLPVPLFDVAKLNLLLWLSKHYFYPIGEVCETAIPAPVRLGTKRTLKTEDWSAPELPPSVPHDKKILNEAQAQALASIVKASGGSKLLWGVTGSGKTEVYLQAMEEKLAGNRGAIVLVPEISLTPQVTERFEKRFPGQVAIFHSALKPSQLRKAWLQTLRGEKRIAVGARSALFAPVQNLGLIVVDEEHDTSYKQEDRLRYHARDGALVLGALAKVPVVLGSATPSSESMHAVNEGKSEALLLPERAASQSKLPPIEVVDLKLGISVENKTPLIEAPESNPPTIKGDFFLSPQLRNAIEATLHDKKQSILFLNRRGLGSQEFCRACGYIPECPNCEIKLTPHASSLDCHYCGYHASVNMECPKCKAGDHPFIQVGVGTEAIEEAVKYHFPKARMLRLDRDTTSSLAEYEAILGKFERKEADILIGTQMVAKGHDFPDVTLVGILLADMGLSMPDYRANERCLQLLLQVSGRAGRSLHPGRVILQSFQPDHEVFTALREQKSLEDYGRFLSSEIEKRRFLRYPPYGRLILLRFDGLEEKGVEKAADVVASALRKIKTQGLQVLGPVVSPLRKIRNRYRWQILIKADNFDACKKAVDWIHSGWEAQKLEKTYRARMIIDVDPVSML
ncbi:MAG: primosomal protein N' [Bdellovibrionales bacterium]|nr:primosomal protein N' [Bdellovibrionales bacterium]